jgi:hypothetical protein
VFINKKPEIDEWSLACNIGKKVEREVRSGWEVRGKRRPGKKFSLPKWMFEGTCGAEGAGEKLPNLEPHVSRAGGKGIIGSRGRLTRSGGHVSARSNEGPYPRKNEKSPGDSGSKAPAQIQ